MMIMIFEVKIEIPDADNTPTQVKYKEALQTWLNESGDEDDFRKWIISSKVTPKRKY
tara:strand:+ start:165 stop:335 length:171 start_codon:yes stop_codon:yes gene_type:complete